MRITTWNVNGLRAAARKGLRGFVEEIRPDVLLLQEVRCRPDQLEPELAEPPGWHVHWHCAERPGYSGVAVWSRLPLEVLGTGIGGDDPEGRVLRVRVGGVQLVNVYLPSGSSSPARQEAKEAWMDVFLPWAAALLDAGGPVVMGGDLNIAHTERDIHDPKGNVRNSGFLPHEREWFGRLLGTGWRDLVRSHAGEVQGPYSWWSNRGRARQLDRGWRIDYLLGSSGVRLARASILREGGLVVSDHAPVTIDIEGDTAAGSQAGAVEA